MIIFIFKGAVVMVVYINKIDNSKTRLTNEHLLLLKMIYQLGFVNRHQLHLLWSIVKQQPKEFSHSGLERWSKHGGLLVTKKYQSQRQMENDNKLPRSVFVCTPAAIELLIASKYISVDDQPTMHAVNLHNELTLQSFIGGLWCAAFIGPYMTDQQITWLYNQPLLSPFSCRRHRHQPPAVQSAPKYQSSFDPAKYNFSSFITQQGVNGKLATQLPFIADLMCSWQQRKNSGNLITNECYIEFDNRSEHAPTTLQKLYNYIMYAIQHPQKDITLHIVCRDRSIFSNLYELVPNMNPFIHLQYILGIMEHYQYFDKEMNEDVFLLAYYERAKNLRIYVSGIEDCYLDIRNHLIMTDVHAKTTASAMKWLKDANGTLIDQAQNHETRLYNNDGVIQLNSGYNTLIVGEYNSIDTIESLKFMCEDAAKQKCFWPCVFYQTGIGNKPTIPALLRLFKAHGGIYRPTQPLLVISKLNGVVEYQTAEKKSQPLLL